MSLFKIQQLIRNSLVLNKSDECISLGAKVQFNYYPRAQNQQAM